MSSSDSDDDHVGYGRPPKEHRFKKGQSGNPSGRRKKTRPLRETLREVFSRPMFLKVDGKLTAFEPNEIRARMLVNSALKGSVAHVKLILQQDLSGELLEAIAKQERTYGALVVPEPAASEAEWESLYGADAQTGQAAGGTHQNEHP
jgi:Family of unknown function (DUF5681)